MTRARIKYVTRENNPYIHEDFANAGVDAVFSQFTQSRVKERYRASALVMKAKHRAFNKAEAQIVLDFIDKLITEIKTAPLENVLQVERAPRNIFDNPNLASEIQSSLDAFSGSGPSNFSEVEDQMNILDKYMKTLEKTTKELDKILNTQAITDVVTGYFLESKGKLNFENFSTIINDFISKNGQRLIRVSLNPIHSSISKLSKANVKMVAYKEALIGIQSMYGLGGAQNILGNKNKVIGKAISKIGQSLFNPLCGDIVGMAKSGAEEFMKTQMIGENIKFISDGTVKFSPKSKSKTNESLTFSYLSSKEGISVDIVGKEQKDLKKDMQFKPSKTYKTLKVSESGSLGDLMVKSGLTSLGAKYSAVNIIGNYGKPNAISDAQNKAVFDYIKAANITSAISNAIGGGMTNAYFVKGGRPFTIYEVLRNLARGDSMFNVEGKLNPTQSRIVSLNKKIYIYRTVYENADARSNAIYSALLNSRFSIQLKTF